jgi:hypothetical protein
MSSCLNVKRIHQSFTGLTINTFKMDMQFSRSFLRIECNYKYK